MAGTDKKNNPKIGERERAKKAGISSGFKLLGISYRIKRRNRVLKIILTKQQFRELNTEKGKSIIGTVLPIIVISLLRVSLLFLKLAAALANY